MGLRTSMQLKQEMPWIVVVAICAFAAIGIAAYGVGAGVIEVNLAAIALIALGLGIVGLLVRGMSYSQSIAELVQETAWLTKEISGLTRDRNSEQRDRQSLMDDMASLRQDSQGMSESIMQSLSSLRANHVSLADGVKSLLEQRKAADLMQQENVQSVMLGQQAAHGISSQLVMPVAPQQFTQPAPESETAQPLQMNAAEAESTQVPFGESLNLSLEPVIDLYTSQTAHYRMNLGMTNDQGTDVLQDVFLHHAERIGMREALDVFVVRETLSILERLRQRDPALCIFVPIGAATLGNRVALQQVLSILQGQPLLATGVVLELPHAVLASLPDRSLEGLAFLARGGVSLSLAQAAIAGVDLAALSKLNVRFIGLAAASLGADTKVTAGLAGFVQSARALRIQVVISHVGDPNQVINLARSARFACGPAFAPPRRLRRNAPENNAQFNVAA